MTVVAVATEYDGYDAEVYLALLRLLRGDSFEHWKTDVRFNGDRSVRKFIDLYLLRAARDDVGFALFAIDNDGGSKRHPEHSDAHVPDEQSADEKDGCRTCWLAKSVPSWWSDQGRRHCVVVPVQSIETWLLMLRGDTLDPSPEQVYDPMVLKKRFFGKPFPPVAVRTERALAQVNSPNVLPRLRQLRSFRCFEDQLLTWP